MGIIGFFFFFYDSKSMVMWYQKNPERKGHNKTMVNAMVNDLFLNANLLLKSGVLISLI